MEENIEFKNDGFEKIITREQLAKMSDEQIEKMATTYSEGNSELKELLMYCAKNQIPTYACCAGHPDKNEHPYVGFILDDNTNDIFSRIFSKTLEKSHITISKSDGYSRFSIYGSNEHPEELNFKEIKNTIEHYKEFSPDETFHKLSYVVQNSHKNLKYRIYGNEDGTISEIYSNVNIAPLKGSDINNTLNAMINSLNNPYTSKSPNANVKITRENKGLENLLHYCSQHEIDVFDSNSMTINGNADGDYISFVLNDKDTGFLSKLFLMQLYENSEMDLYKDNNEIRLSVSFHDSYTDPKFAQIQSCFENHEKYPNIPIQSNIFEKIISFLKNSIGDIQFIINGFSYAKEQNLPLLDYYGRENLKRPAPINDYPSTADSCEIINKQFDDLIKSFENPKSEQHLGEKGVEKNSSNKNLANIKDFCKEVSYKQMGLNMLNSFITKIKNFGKTKDNERSKPWTR